MNCFVEIAYFICFRRHVLFKLVTRQTLTHFFKLYFPGRECDPRVLLIAANLLSNSSFCYCMSRILDIHFGLYILVVRSLGKCLGVCLVVC